MKFTEINLFLWRAKIRQSEIANALGLHKSTVSALLCGRIYIDTQLDRIAGYLKISRKKLDAMIQGGREAAA